MAYKKILEDGRWIASYDKERDITKITIDKDKMYRVEFALEFEEIEDFYYFIKEVKDLTV